MTASTPPNGFGTRLSRRGITHSHTARATGIGAAGIDRRDVGTVMRAHRAARRAETRATRTPATRKDAATREQAGGRARTVSSSRNRGCLRHDRFCDGLSRSDGAQTRSTSETRAKRTPAARKDASTREQAGGRARTVSSSRSRGYLRYDCFCDGLSRSDGCRRGRLQVAKLRLDLRSTRDEV